MGAIIVPEEDKKKRCPSNKIKVRSLYDYLNKNFSNQEAER